jgi:hypothetical protein
MEKHTETKELGELERDPSGFKYLSPNGLFNIPKDFSAPLTTRSSYASAKAFDLKAAEKKAK